jgi:hypothetical protein
VPSDGGGHGLRHLLRPERLETILASVLDRRQERTERRREHRAELHKRIAETDLRLNGSSTPSSPASPISTPPV